ncbi:F0F1 ATP synthase subunit gamma [Alishewanella tabrizica]|uniref:F0F1 ATP synthase subunit gamma n=1 Tax=Alishewanella tabrizica TaxID=671278 RepID=A0ABQ2WHW5_9ALTE|nr:F0F1 ATP synthase subunit gamma [Alishewanella tabrizica]GGW57249.1 F0F1 ATP synthase subunit gamma [Alishewanella tabrizica]
MSESTAGLTRKINSAADLLAVVRTMKAMTASHITQYERAVDSLGDYYRTVQLGLRACFNQTENITDAHNHLISSGGRTAKLGVLVFGSDQGLVGQFNESLAEFVLADLAKQQSDKTVWVVGERLQSRLMQSNLTLEQGFALPKAINTITPLVSELLLEMETYRAAGKINQVAVFHNQPDHTQSGAIYRPVKQRLLPLDQQWQQQVRLLPWPTNNLPEVVVANISDNAHKSAHNSTHKNTESSSDANNNPLGNRYQQTQLALIHEFLFVSLYRACAESLASENASRLAAMQRAEKNIDELLLKMKSQFNGLRQSGIDEELFDVIAGFNALSVE